MVHSQVPTFDPEKFKNLILFIAMECRNDERFGLMKLSKMLYYCDFEAFRRLRRPITGATYVKMTNGPVPKEIYDMRRELVAEGRARVEPRRVFDYNEQRLVPVVEGVELSDQFDDDEREIIGEVIDWLRHMSGAEVSRISHGEFGWRFGEFKEPISYDTASIAREDDPTLLEWVISRVA